MKSVPLKQNTVMCVRACVCVHMCRGNAIYTSTAMLDYN